MSQVDKLFLEGPGINILGFAGQALSQLLNSAIVVKGGLSSYAQVPVYGGIINPGCENFSFNFNLSLRTVNYKKTSSFTTYSFISHNNLVQLAEQLHKYILPPGATGFLCYGLGKLPSYGIQSRSLNFLGSKFLILFYCFENQMLTLFTVLANT